MDLYTLNENFLGKDTIDEFVSAIWTERYSAAGDVQLVVPATQTNVDKLAEGTFLALRGTKEVMELKTQSVEEGLMTVVGTSLTDFLNERIAWFKNPDSFEEDKRIIDYTDSTKKSGEFIADVVYKMVINPVAFTAEYAPANLDWVNEKIPNLSLGPVDTSGVAEKYTIPIGPLYDGIAEFATKEGVGISLYLESANPLTGYILKFTTYRGKDHTTGGAFPLVRLVPEMDSISDLKEIRSIAVYKNVCYVYYKGIITTHLAEPSLPAPEGFARRSLVTNAEGEPVGRKVAPILFGVYSTSTPGSGSGYTPPQTVVGPAEIAAFRAQHAKDALANHNYIRAVDGQTSPKNDYKYGVDYGLGDIIELEGISGNISKARVTEYIRSQDKTGEREYPTISVVT